MIQRVSSYVPLFTSAKVSLKHWESLLPTSLLRRPFCRLQQVGEAGASVVIKIWPVPGWWHVFKLPKGSPKTSTTIRIHPEASATSSFPGASYHPEGIFDPEPHFTILRPLPLLYIYHSKVLTSSGTSPLRGSPCFEDFSYELYPRQLGVSRVRVWSKLLTETQTELNRTTLVRSGFGFGFRNSNPTESNQISHPYISPHPNSDLLNHVVHHKNW